MNTEIGVDPVGTTGFTLEVETATGTGTTKDVQDVTIIVEGESIQHRHGNGIGTNIEITGNDMVEDADSKDSLK